MIDSDGFRLNVGIILANARGEVLWAKRIGQDAWQFPQGGLKKNETAEQALFRELTEELGLSPEDVSIIAATEKWLPYRLPGRLIRHYSKPKVIGQKQKWYLLNLIAPDLKIKLDLSERPEFDGWRWVPYWYPLEHIIDFKKNVYEQALNELAPHLKK